MFTLYIGAEGRALCCQPDFAPVAPLYYSELVEEDHHDADGAYEPHEEQPDAVKTSAHRVPVSELAMDNRLWYHPSYKETC